ncbi:MAG TPA: methyltransferase [Verrucomicrobiae bacterium]|nr:methyltransferase [Verrucomicrobiae bacterium]
MNPIMTPSPLNLFSQTDPREIYRLRDGLYAVDLMAAALVEFDFFTWLAANPSDLAAICAHFKIHPRPADVMITLFAALGAVERQGNEIRATPLAREFLVQGSPLCVAPYFASMRERPVCRDMAIVLRTGHPANWGSFDHEKEWAKAMETEDFAKRFTAAMDCRGACLGPAMAAKLKLDGHRRVLDIAGGSGVYACAIAAAHPHVQATVLEKKPVDAIARKGIAERGFADRVSVHVADMFKEPFPAEHDVHLFSNVLHDWDTPLVKTLLAKSSEALPAGGLLVVHDAHINREKTGPYPVAAYSSLLMTITEGKCYSISEMEEYLTEAGFEDFEFHETTVDRSILTAWKI